MVTTQIDLTPEKALELLRKARDLKGADYVYRPEDLNKYGERIGACRYREDDGSPSCIAGHVLAWAGFELTDAMEGTMVNGLDLGLGSDVVRVLLRAQRAQDTAHTWGEAVTQAEAVAREYGVTV